MLLGVRFTLRILGVERDGMLTRFVEQEFQAMVRDQQNVHYRPLSYEALKARLDEVMDARAGH